MRKIRGNHSSPGVYTQFTDLSYAAKTLGITKLGLVGETLYGPAFDPTPVVDWADFTSKFGGTSAEKFKDSQYPKYELPYIAKSYLSASDQLLVCRVLGLSGYNAGHAFVITANDRTNPLNTNNYVVAVIRPKGVYDKNSRSYDPCTCAESPYDTVSFECTSISLEPYTTPAMKVICSSETQQGSREDYISVSPTSLGRFTIVCRNRNNEIIGRYAVSLNAGSKDYIYNVIGNNPNDSSACIYVEELFDLRLKELVDAGTVNEISSTVLTYKALNIAAVTDPVADFVSTPIYSLTRSDVGNRFLSDLKGSTIDGNENYGFYYYATDKYGNFPTVDSKQPMAIGGIYYVKPKIKKDSTIEYVYVQLKDADGLPISIGTITPTSNPVINNVNGVKLLSTNTFYCLSHEGTEVIPVSDMSNYRESFRCATTPWIVSELKGDGVYMQVKKLFRFHTISDGNSANSMIKISVSNIRPDEGLFDVTIRDFYDTDSSPIILEMFRNLTMEPGNSNYIGLKIGTIDGAYETVSKFVLVEIIDNELTRTCVPCGFLGYPTRDFQAEQATSGSTASGTTIVNPSFTYNTDYNEEIKPKKQYFGLSDIKGVDVDMLSYKGRNAYTETYTNGYTNSFHLDSTLSPELRSSLYGQEILIDGDPDTKYVKWTTVNPAFTSDYTHAPIIGSESEMAGCIYEDKNLRKFTVYPCGGFDGWDIFRGSRTNTNEYKYNKYKGFINNGYGPTFSKVENAELIGLDGKAITSDYYAYLAGVNQFEIPEKNVINLFATPGIDYVNNSNLVDEVIEMISEKRGDSLYVVTTPDKPFGASDARDEMYTSAEAADNLDESGVDTYYAATYYPWVKFFDGENAMYINLPATKDVLRNMADVDNKRYPWFAPAGLERGKVECKKMHFFARIEDEDNVYNGRINPLKTFSEDGVKIWGNKTMYTGDTPMNRINVVRLMLYMRNLISRAALKLIFDPNDTTLKDEFDGILRPILSQIKKERGIVDYKLSISQTQEQMDAHEMSATIWVKPSPTLEYIEINFVVTPIGVEFED